MLLASSSAALVPPIVNSLHPGGGPVLQLLPQVARSRMRRASWHCRWRWTRVTPGGRCSGRSLYSSFVAVAVLFVILRYLKRTGVRRRLSAERKLALELRINLVIEFALAALATATHVSIMLAGSSFGLVVAAIGEPRRLARQLFAVTDVFFGPPFFVWLAASLDLRELGRHPALIGLGLALGTGAVVTHAAMRLTGQPAAVAALAAAQLGLPVAAATIGSQSSDLAPGEPAALLLGALFTIAVAVLAGSMVARAGLAGHGFRKAQPTTGRE